MIVLHEGTWHVAVDAADRTAVVEVFRDAGGKRLRALLGGHAPGHPPAAVPTAAVVHSALSTPLVPGLPDEFAGPVRDHLAALGRPVVIDRGAHDEVDSCEEAFRLAAEVLAEVLAPRDLAAWEERVREVVRRR
ncbi:hypothetical protein [Actinosynnema sp. NPDC020468]|uniref:hypothetical protein n=1 Tax=Actinosynnema sp. NPDC020468 TaxID=3154488 RepID=UPI0033FA65B7